MRSIRRLGLAPAFLLLFLAPLREARSSEEMFMAVELQGKLIGYRKTSILPAERLTHIELKLTALGQDFDVRVEQKRTTDPDTGRTLALDLDIVRGGQELGYSTRIRDGEAVFTPSVGGSPKTIALTPDVIVDDDVDLTYLLRDFGPGSGKDVGSSANYQVFDFTLGEIHEQSFTYAADESLALLGEEHRCLVFESVDRQSGLRAKFWVDRDNARVLRSELSNGMTAYLTDASVIDNITRGNLDDSILARVDVAIADIKAISTMRVQARVRTAGEWVTAESLNIPGQRFEGTVEDNVIDGVFEIEHPTYDGRGAPPFPPDFDLDDELSAFLKPEDMIEADDPIIADKAFELTRGATDSWDAARRLGRWVAEEITYEIPGGSARHTLDTRKGECGSHSRLMTALCRAVGIPARLATGCMYTPFGGGSFGQHAWNEVYMGEAGWVPIDTTAMEPDYVDSGHIRLGMLTSFNPISMKILDFRAGAASMSKAPAALELIEVLPYEIGRDYVYTYKRSGTPLGHETFAVTEVDEAEGLSTCSSKVDLGVYTTSNTWTVGPEGMLRDYTMSGKAGATEFSIECRFTAGKVEEKLVQGGSPVERTIELPESFVMIANNCVGLLCVLMAATPEEVGATRAFRFFHPTQMQVFAGQLTVVEREAIPWGGQEVTCRRVTLNLMGTEIILWVDDAGRLLRETEAGGSFVMELEAGEGAG